MHKLDVPYFSQHQDVLDPAWQPRSCGIACAKMLLQFHKQDHDESIDDLIAEAVLMGGYTKHGWQHDALVNLLRNRGIHAYREEFRSQSIDSRTRVRQQSPYEQHLTRNGISKIANHLFKGKPVIVSVDAGFGENTSSHLIVITGFAEDEVGLEGFFYNDPDSQAGIKKDLFVELPKFRKFWRKLAIFAS